MNWWALLGQFLTGVLIGTLIGNVLYYMAYRRWWK